MTCLPAAIDDPDFRRLYDYWSVRRGSRFAPAREDLDPRDMRFVLGDLLLLDVLAGPLRFRFRLHGTNLVVRAGYDMTGRPIDELPGADNRRWLQRRCRSLVDGRAPVHGRHDRVIKNRRWRYDVLWLPLSGDGATVDMLLGALRYRESWWEAEPSPGASSIRFGSR